jgi:hypothetical protein
MTPLSPVCTWAPTSWEEQKRRALAEDRPVTRADLTAAIM